MVRAIRADMTDLEVALFVVAVILVLFVLYFRRKALIYYENWQTRQSDAYTMGTHQVMGDMSQILGTFAILGDYEQIILLSTTSSQASMDLLGVKSESLDFIELKKKGASLGKAERRIQRLVKEGKVRYVVKDVELPDSIQVTERTKQSY